LTLPLEAGDSIDEIVAESLLKKTPFKPDDIYCDHVALKATEGNKISVWQWVARRNLVHESLSRLQVNSENVALVVGDHDTVGGGPPPAIKLRPRTQVRKSLVKNYALALTCSAGVLALVAGGLRYWHQQTILDHLETQTAAIKSKAQRVRALVDRLQEKQNVLHHLRRQRDNVPGLIDVWEEATRVLPSHTWLTELRLETSGKQEQQMIIIGFSAAAPSLVGIVDSSSLFSDAVLTAPVSLDPVERVERFALQAKVVLPGQAGKLAQ
jgi:general secretion pathway protein L